MLPEERLNDLAAREIDALEADGIRPTAAEVVKLNALGWAIETPCARRELSRGVPVMLCEGVYLWPLTIQAADWQDRVGENLTPSKTDLLFHHRLSVDLPLVALAYAMAHAYAEGSELEIDGPGASKTVLRWASRLKCTAEGLKEAIADVVAQQDSPDFPHNDDGRRMSVGEFSIHLSARCGGTPEFWERRCSISYAATLLASVAHQSAADGKTISGDLKISALSALGIESERIRNERAANV